MKKLFFIVTIIFFAAHLISQQIEVIESEIIVSGNCSLCKERIEKSIKIPEVKYAKWNKSTKKLKIAYESTITLDSLKHRIAIAGHDNDKYKASDSTYNNLPKCCLYRDNPNTH